jgi:hypothetical protein
MSPNRQIAVICSDQSEKSNLDLELPTLLISPTDSPMQSRFSNRRLATATLALRTFSINMSGLYYSAMPEFPFSIRRGEHGGSNSSDSSAGTSLCLISEHAAVIPSR